MDRCLICREMNERDLDDVMRIERAVFKRPWTEEFFRLILSDMNNYIITLRDRDLIGYGGYHLLKNSSNFLHIQKTYPRIIHLISIAINPGFQHRGFGTMLMNMLMNDALSKKAGYCYLEVRPSNMRALSFYQSRSFSIIGFIENYYAQEHENAYVMGKEITPRLNRL